MKVERYSYPTMTPSAARGVLDAIYLKPKSFRWQVERIALLQRRGGAGRARTSPSFVALRRHEVKDVANVRSVQAWMAGTKEPEPIWADGDKATLGSDEKGRTQRQTMALRHPHFRIWAHVVVWAGHEDAAKAADAQFVRRARAGKCFQQPFLGCREFPAYFELVEGDDAPATSESPIDESAVMDVDLDLGFMLYDVFDLSAPGHSHSPPRISLFQARIEGGVLEVPPWDDPRIFKASSTGGGGAQPGDT
jgi:CRISPR-associated protein Cas5d